MEFVAHRAGNSAEHLRAVEGIVDHVEVDLHLGRDGGLDARHAKVLWPTRRLWERWYVLPRDTAVTPFSEVMEAIGSSTGLWLDLKGVSPRLARLARPMVEGHRRLTVSTKSWWLLPSFVEMPGVRTFRSAGNRTELALLMWLPSRVRPSGAVVHRRLLSEGVVRRLKRRGLIFTWAVDDAETVSLMYELGVDGVILDDIGLVRPDLRLAPD